MLKGEVEALDLSTHRDELLELVDSGVDELQQSHGIQAISIIDNAEQVDIEYPIPVVQVSIRCESMEANTGIVNEYIEAPVLGHAAFNH